MAATPEPSATAEEEEAGALGTALRQRCYCLWGRRCRLSPTPGHVPARAERVAAVVEQLCAPAAVGVRPVRAWLRAATALVAAATVRVVRALPGGDQACAMTAQATPCRAV